MEINGFNKAQQAKPIPGANSSLTNNSGAGKDSPVLDIVAKRFNWGACLLSWIWGLGNRSYITLIIFPIAILGIIPVLGIIVQLGVIIWFGINGNKWAWQNKRWNSIEEFHRVQKKWAIAGLILEIIIAILIPCIILATTLPILMSNTEEVRNETMIKKEVSTAMQVALMGEAMDTKCQPESLAKCFAEHMNVTSVSDSEIQASDGSTWKFAASGNCKEEGECQVAVNSGYGDDIIIPLYINSEGHIKIKSEDVESYIK